MDLLCPDTWDEHTFLLVGQEVLRGGLPLVDIFDIKPPLLFYWFAAIEAFAGKNIAAFRVAAAMWVLMGAMCIYHPVRRRSGDFVGLLSALGVISVSLASRAGLAVMSEIVMLPFLCAFMVGAMRLWEPEPKHPVRAALVAGVLGGGAICVRPNIAIVVCGVGCVLVLAKIGQKRALPWMAALVVGGAVTIAAVLAPYYLGGHMDSIARFLAAAREYSSGTWRTWDAVLAIPFLWALWSARSSEPPATAMRLTGAWGVAFSIASIRLTGDYFSHYLIQLAPAAALLLGSALRRMPGHRAIPGEALLRLAACATLLLIAAPSILLAIKVAGSGAPQAQNIVRLANDLRTRGGTGLLFVDHGALWLAGKQPPSSPLTHPTNILRVRMLNAASGRSWDQAKYLEEAFDSGPEIVQLGGFLEDARVDPMTKERAVLRLLRDYEPVNIGGLGTLWVRRAGLAAAAIKRAPETTRR